MNEKVMVSPEIQSEAVVLPQIVSIKQASQRMGLLNITSAAFAGSAGHGISVGHQMVYQPWKDGRLLQRWNDNFLTCQGCGHKLRHPKN